jgi:DNA repair protein RadC
MVERRKMDSKEYFENNKENILETAKFLRSKEPSRTVEEQFEILKQQYINCDGTKHEETINGYDISAWLDIIRHKKTENFVIIAVYKKQCQVIFEQTGDQFSSQNIDMMNIDKQIVRLITFECAMSIGIYVMHNHPYIYKALPSTADLETAAAILNELNNIMTCTREHGINCNVELLDFGIVTEYDYWSIKQS